MLLFSYIFLCLKKLLFSFSLSFRPVRSVLLIQNDNDYHSHSEFSQVDAFYCYNSLPLKENFSLFRLFCSELHIAYYARWLVKLIFK